MIFVIKYSQAYLFWVKHCIFVLPGVHRQKQKMPKVKSTLGNKPFDPITPVAEEISGETWLLCFDEFQVGSVDCGVYSRS